MNSLWLFANNFYGNDVVELSVVLVGVNVVVTGVNVVVTGVDKTVESVAFVCCVVVEKLVMFNACCVVTCSNVVVF